MGEKIGVSKAAEILGISKRTVYKRLRSGQIPGKKVPYKDDIQRWIIDKDDLTQQATIQNDIVNVKEINKPIAKEELLKELIQAIDSRNKQVITDAVDNINQTIEQTIEKQNERITTQNKAIKQLSEQIQELKNQTFLDKLKNFFK